MTNSNMENSFLTSKLHFDTSLTFKSKMASKLNENMASVSGAFTGLRILFTFGQHGLSLWILYLGTLDNIFLRVDILNQGHRQDMTILKSRSSDDRPSLRLGTKYYYLRTNTHRIMCQCVCFEKGNMILWSDLHV